MYLLVSFATHAGVGSTQRLLCFWTSIFVYPRLFLCIWISFCVFTRLFCQTFSYVEFSTSFFVFNRLCLFVCHSRDSCTCFSVHLLVCFATHAGVGTIQHLFLFFTSILVYLRHFSFIFMSFCVFTGRFCHRCRCREHSTSPFVFKRRFLFVYDSFYVFSSLCVYSLVSFAKHADMKGSQLHFLFIHLFGFIYRPDWLYTSLSEYLLFPSATHADVGHLQQLFLFLTSILVYLRLLLCILISLCVCWLVFSAQHMQVAGGRVFNVTLCLFSLFSVYLPLLLFVYVFFCVFAGLFCHICKRQEYSTFLPVFNLYSCNISSCF